MKKIITSLGMIVFVGAVVAGGTGAFFSDTETSTANVFTAGAIDLKIDNSSYGFDWNDPAVTDPQGDWGPNNNNSWDLNDLTDQLFFNFIDLKPGDFGEDTISIHVDNNDAYACMAFDLTGTPENGQNDPEAEVDNTAGADDGELQNYLSFLFWHDDGDNVLEEGEEVINSLTGLSSEIFSGEWLPLAESGDDPFVGGETAWIGKGWCFGDISPEPVAPGDYGAPTVDNTGFACTGAEGDHNDAQTDGIVVDVAFHAVQARHNDDFRCDSLPPLDGGDPEPRQLVGAALSDYVAPSCDVTVTGSESIQTAVDGVAVDGTVCVDPSYDMTGDDVAIRIETEGVTLAATVRGVDLDVPVVLSNSNVTVTGFDGLIGQAESPAEQAAFYVDGDADSFEISFNTVDGGVGAGILTETGGANGGGLIANNTLSGATQGIYTNPHTGVFVIEYNDIDDNVAGIAGLNGATVRFNEFEHSVPGSEAIGADPSIDSNSATVNFNNFLDGTMFNTYVGLAADVDAEDNFWGPSGGATQTGGTDEVNFTPEEVSAFPHN